MIQVIDEFDVQDWTVSGTGITASTDEVFYFDTGKSVRITLDEGNTGAKISKSFGTVDLTGFEELRFQIKSLYNTAVRYKDDDDFVIEIKITDSGLSEYEWNVPIAHVNFSMARLDLTGIDDLTDIEISFKNIAADIIWLDYMLLFKDELEYDFLSSIKEKLHEKITRDIGTLTSAASAGSESIQVSDVSYITEGTMIKITEGATVEYKQVGKEPQESTLYFSELLNDGKLQNSFSIGADVTLIVPAYFENADKDIYLPAITIWGFNPERNRIFDSENNITLDYPKGDKFKQKGKDRHFTYDIQLTSEAWQPEILQEMNDLIRSIFDNDVFLQIAGQQIMYDVTDSSFSFSGDQTEPHSNFKTISFNAVQNYGELNTYKMSGTVNVSVSTQEA